MTETKYAAFKFDHENPKHEQILTASLDEVIFGIARTADGIDPDTLDFKFMDEQKPGEVRLLVTYEHGDVDGETLDTRPIARRAYQSLYAS